MCRCYLYRLQLSDPVPPAVPYKLGPKFKCTSCKMHLCMVPSTIVILFKVLHITCEMQVPATDCSCGSLQTCASCCTRTASTTPCVCSTTQQAAGMAPTGSLQQQGAAHIYKFLAVVYARFMLCCLLYECTEQQKPCMCSTKNEQQRQNSEAASL
jgi:hypothetical protein